MTKIYLDYNATSPVHDDVRAMLLDSLDIFGNPSSVHSYGQNAQKAIDDVRKIIADYLGLMPRNIIFTGSATEANNMIIAGNDCDILLVPRDEHDSILGAVKHFNKQIRYLDIMLDGNICPNSFNEAIDFCQKNSLKPLFTVMKVNNETGKIKDFLEYSQKIRQIGGIVHSDCVQAIGKIPFANWSFACDVITLGFHKIGGMKGIGILAIRDNIILSPLIYGGGQEINRRAGTHNIPLICSLKGVFKNIDWHLAQNDKYKIWQNYMITELSNYVQIPIMTDMVSNILYIIGNKFDAQTQVIMADLHGFAISSGSACSSGKVRGSHVLKAYGYDDKAASSGIRVSYGFASNENDIDKFIEFYKKYLL